jgi:hypothetical protein
MLIVSPEFNCSQEILTIVAMLSGALFASIVDEADTIPLQSPTFGYDRTTGDKKPILRSSYCPYLMGTTLHFLMSLMSTRTVHISLTSACCS